MFNTVLAQGFQKIQDTDCVVGGVPTLKCLEVVFGNLLFIASSVVMLILFIMLVIGAMKYLLSGGDSKKVSEASQTLKWALIGTALFATSFLIIRIIQSLFLKEGYGLDRFTIEQPTPTP